MGILESSRDWRELRRRTVAEFRNAPAAVQEGAQRARSFWRKMTVFVGFVELLLWLTDDSPEADREEAPTRRPQEASDESNPPRGQVHEADEKPTFKV